jgi:hypothetical protein
MKFILTGLMLCSLLAAQAQQRTCGTMDVHNRMMQQHPERLEHYNATKAAIAELQTSQGSGRQTRATVIKIPVVVHIIHNGVPIGTGQNVSDAQVLSQIDALNEDYRKKNADSLKPNHPFYGVTGDASIEFCLAVKDPNGNATTGIKRYSVNASSISDVDMDGTIKPQTIWNSEKYLNMWVANITAQNPILGYAQFPGSGSANTDGVVILTTAFGYTGNVVAPYNNGRTAVHEVGHWLGLYHIWGDDNGACTGSDNVADTRNAGDANYGAPSFPNNVGVCGANGSGDMFMNYMDYVNDTSMVMFTKGQIGAMQGVLANAFGGRLQLTVSEGCDYPAAVADITIGNAVNIFPNPVQDVLTVQVPDAATNLSTVVYSLGGQIAIPSKMQDVNHGTVTLQVAGLTPGVYILRVQDGRNTVSRKFTKL